MKTTYTCPVCGYDGLDEAPYGENFAPSNASCDCCNFEFGYSEDYEVDLGYTVVPNEMKAAAFQLYRKQWVEKGAVVGNKKTFPKSFQKKGSVKREVIIKQFERIGLKIDQLVFMIEEEEREHPIWSLDWDIRAAADKQIMRAEKQLGVTLPALYKELLKVQNGGYLIHYAYPLDFPTSWAEDHIEINQLYGIDSESSILDSAYLIKEWGLPKGIVIISGDGHTWVALDYRKSSEHPSILLIDKDVAGIKTIAPDFATFMDGFITDDGPMEWVDWVIYEASLFDEETKNTMAEEARNGRSNEEIQRDFDGILENGTYRKIASTFTELLNLRDADIERYMIEQVIKHRTATVRESVASHLAACAIKGFDTLTKNEVEKYLMAMQEKERHEQVCFFIETGLSKLAEGNER